MNRHSSTVRRGDASAVTAPARCLTADSRQPTADRGPRARVGVRLQPVRRRPNNSRAPWKILTTSRFLSPNNGPVNRETHRRRKVWRVAARARRPGWRRGTSAVVAPLPGYHQAPTRAALPRVDGTVTGTRRRRYLRSAHGAPLSYTHYSGPVLRNCSTPATCPRLGDRRLYVASMLGGSGVLLPAASERFGGPSWGQGEVGVGRE